MSRRFLAGTELRAVSYRAFEKGKLSRPSLKLSGASTRVVPCAPLFCCGVRTNGDAGHKWCQHERGVQCFRFSKSKRKCQLE
jgi:hypothetical protein